MADHECALLQLRQVLPLPDSELAQIRDYISELGDAEAAAHLRNLLDDSPESARFIDSYIERRNGRTKQHSDAPEKTDTDKADDILPPSYANSTAAPQLHTNALIEVAQVRERDEQEMQQALQDLQYRYRIYNSDIEPEHDVGGMPCVCPIHQYVRKKQLRIPILERWSKVVQYPGEKLYSEKLYGDFSSTVNTSNPYSSITSVFGNSPWGGSPFSLARPIPECYTDHLRETISLNDKLNQKAAVKINSLEPKNNIWEEDYPEEPTPEIDCGDTNSSRNERGLSGMASISTKRQNLHAKGNSVSRLSKFRKAFGINSSIEKENELRDAILVEEKGRWPDEQWRHIVATYQEKVGMTEKIVEIRSKCPLQYLHLLRAGYFEPIPVAWANKASNPLKFTIEAARGIRGITPTWRGYENLAEERLYWVLNHRTSSIGLRMKPDFISEMNMAQARMATAVEPPPLYFSADDTCNVQHMGAGYSRQVMPTPFHPYGRPEVASDDSILLLDISGSMDFEPVRPVYDQYLITGFQKTTQPKNRDVARAIVRRFTDALAAHDHQSQGYDLVTFADKAKYIGPVNHGNFNEMWQNIHFGGATRVMTGWQMVKDLHFQKYSASAVHHPIYGWQAGPETPILRLLLLLDGEATDMDEFELDLLSLSWAHVTIFLIGVDGCPHHHRHANELQRISNINHHVSFVDAQGNCPERFVTHELLKRHLGYDISMREFEEMEQLPGYAEVESTA